MKIVVKLSIIYLFVSTNLIAQITLRDKNKIDTNLNSIELESLSKIFFLKKVIDNKKYIGQKLYFAPTSRKYNTNKTEIINYLTTKDSTQITKSGKIAFEKLYFYSEYKDEKLKLITVEKYENWKKNYEEIDKAITNVYEPKFYHEKTDATYGKIFGNLEPYQKKLKVSTLQF